MPTPSTDNFELMVGVDKTTKFMRFWKTVNEILEVRGQPAMLFGEARQCWDAINGD